MKIGKIKVYVYIDAQLDMTTDQKYHNYFVVEEGYPPRTATMHDEEFIPSEVAGKKGTYRIKGDYMVGPGFFDPDYCREVQPCECSPSIVFAEYGLVKTLPSHSDHCENGFEKPYEFVVNQDIE